jgi:alginate O-acetyltransferase complex protein AlgI
MIFNSVQFLCFFAIILVLHNLPFRWTFKKFNLLLGSYVFYAAWNPPFVALLWLSTVVDWYAGKRLEKENRKAMRRLLLLSSVVTNLGLLGFFKYGGFLLENFVAFTDLLGFEFQPASPDIILPVGISFYTFQTMSYTLDIYRKKMAPAESFLDFALYVTFFPQLVAGPIVRSGHLIPQFREPRKATGSDLSWGLGLLSLGLFQKVVLADGLLASTADAVFDSADPVNGRDAWIGTLAFSGQIFCDFSGYSTCAIGIGRCLGFSLPQNFHSPYAAIGFSDFWSRWHISLSSWLKDYLYIPLGGNRRGRMRTYANLMTTMFIGGLWHGASWTFVAWGVIHGLYLSLERFLAAILVGRAWARSTAIRLGAGVLTYFMVTLTWVFFRSQNFSTAWKLLQSMFGAGVASRILTDLAIAQVLVVTGGLVGVQWCLRNTRFEKVVERAPWWLIGPGWAVMVLVLVATFVYLQSRRGSTPFIYFQF